MQRGVIAWYIAAGYYFQLATAVTATSPCTAQYGGFVYFIFSNVITKFDTSTNGVSMQQLSAGPSTDSLCVQQPLTDSVIIGDIIPVNSFDSQARVSGWYLNFSLLDVYKCRSLLLILYRKELIIQSIPHRCL
jgi:hypothetical protein